MIFTKRAIYFGNDLIHNSHWHDGFRDRRWTDLGRRSGLPKSKIIKVVVGLHVMIYCGSVSGVSLHPDGQHLWAAGVLEKPCSNRGKYLSITICQDH